MMHLNNNNNNNNNNIPCHSSCSVVIDCTMIMDWSIWPHLHSSPPLAACSLQCYCHFDPGESGLIEDNCLKTPPNTCNVTHAQGHCFYTRGQHRLSGGRKTVTIEYGCDTTGDECHDFENHIALTQCCDTDFCNRNFSKLLAFERPVNITTTNLTVTPTSSKKSLKYCTSHVHYW